MECLKLILEMCFPLDASGRPLRLAISGGQLHDSKMIDCFLNWSKPPLAIVADKAYGSARIRREIEDEGALPVIPAKANANNPIPHDVGLCAKRNLVERFFCRMKDMRLLTVRYEKRAENFLNMVRVVRYQMLVQLSPGPNSLNQSWIDGSSILDEIY